MRHSILAALIALSLALSRCSKNKASARPDRLASTERQISKDQLFEESKRIAAGEKVGADLATPEIVVSRTASPSLPPLISKPSTTPNMNSLVESAWPLDERRK